MLTLILSLVAGFTPLLQKYIGTTGESLAATGIASLGNLITAWKSGSKTNEVQASLTTIQGVLADLAKDPSTDSATLAQIAEVAKLVEAAIAGFEAAEADVDPNALQVPPPVA